MTQRCCNHDSLPQHNFLYLIQVVNILHPTSQVTSATVGGMSGCQRFTTASIFLARSNTRESAKFYITYLHRVQFGKKKSAISLLISVHHLRLTILVPGMLTVLQHQLILADTPVGLAATITAMYL
jgi:hypothetical protein